MNLPVSIHFLDDKQIKYIYDATGTKLQKQIYVNNTLTSTKSYAGAFIYEKSSSGGSEQLHFFSHAEGYVEKVDQVYYKYFYQYKDHLGNVRLNYAKGPDGLMIKEENNYYPFGVKHKGYNTVIVGRDHNYGYGNKEQQDELGLDGFRAVGNPPLVIKSANYTSGLKGTYKPGYIGFIGALTAMSAAATIRIPIPAF
ncbi:hypothetical protein [Nonlabens sp. SY33080]|uniref:hypothetical protein n=1 Tax=Nonlabens sp. SY33080 TaxID=2719911 RepID=UPI001428C8A0|nr:hypothetical protein [Nonlabens sp. SY33080]